MTFLNHGNFHRCKEICHLNNTSHKMKLNIYKMICWPSVPSPSHQASLPLAYTYSRRLRGNEWVPSPKYMIVCVIEVLLMSLRSVSLSIYSYADDMKRFWHEDGWRTEQSMITKTQDDKNVNYDKDDQGWPLTMKTSMTNMTMINK